MLLFIVLFMPYISCFNFDTNFPIVYSSPTNGSTKSSYFGYSLSLYADKFSSWIFIGAPRDESSKNNSLHNPGVCYKCKINKPCEEINISERVRGKFGKLLKQTLDNAWIGGAMDINYDSQRIVTCAFRWTKVNPPLRDRMKGSCYWFYANNTNRIHILSPFIGLHDDIYYQQQTGISVHMPLEKGKLILGAPGFKNWKGATVLYDSNENGELSLKTIRGDAIANEFELLGYSSTSGYFYGPEKLFYVSGLPKSVNYHGKVIVYQFNERNNFRLVLEESKAGSQFGEYFGASLAAGDVNNDGYDDLIVGAPFYANEGYNEGKVYVFLGSTKTLSSVEHAVLLFGNNSNSQFGTCVQYLGDINSDGFGDLAISAPYEAEKSGVVYLYRGSSSGVDTTFCQRIVGKDIFSEILGFGITISRAADIDHNRSPDVAIGAYLSGHVVVLRANPVVTVHHNLSAFSSHVDISQEFFNISACFWCTLNQLDSHITIRRTVKIDEQLGRASVRQTQSVELVLIPYNESVCQNVTINLEKSFLNKHDPLTISLTHELISEKTSKSVILISGNGVNGTDLFHSNRPLEDKFRSSTVSTLQLPFGLGCASDNICISSLEFELALTNLCEGNVFVLGSKDVLTLTTIVKNVGENAYLTKILFTIPEVVGFQSTPSNCMTQNFSSITCFVDNPLKSNDSKIIILDLDMTKLNNGYEDESLIFTAMVQTASKNNRKDTKLLKVKIQHETDITIGKKSKEDTYSYNGSEENTLNFMQTYLVETFGRSPLNQFFIEIDIPHFIRKKTDILTEITRLHTVSGKIDDQETIFCSSNITYTDETDQDTYESESSMEDEGRKRRSSVPTDISNNNSTNKTHNEVVEGNEYNIPHNRTFHIDCSMLDVVCSKIICEAGPLKSGQVARIDIDILLNVSVVKNFLNKNNVIQYTTRGRVRIVDRFVQSGDRPDVTEISSFFIGENVKESVPLWIIVVSAIGGLLLLLLLTVGLRKAGFFKRKTKEQLQQLKMDFGFLEDPIVQLQ